MNEINEIDCSRYNSDVIAADYSAIPETNDLLAETSLFSFSPEEEADVIKAGLVAIGVHLIQPDILSCDQLDSVSRQLLPPKIRFNRTRIDRVLSTRIDESNYLFTLVLRETGDAIDFELGHSMTNYQDLPPDLFLKVT